MSHMPSQMETRATGEVHFQSYNPYEALYPNLRVVSRETYHLIKRLRLEGYTVVVEPDDGRELCYVVEKGLGDILSNPVVALIVNIPISIVTGFFTAWFYDLLKRPPKPEESILEYDEGGNRVRYSHSGKLISD
jgi:hypothetical protein